MNTNTIPDKFYSGDSVNWEQQFDLYPASSYDCEYVLINDTGKNTISTTKDGDIFKVELTSVQSVFNAGTYKIYAIITEATNKYTVEVKNIEVLESLTSLNSKNIVSHNKKVLDSICAVIEQRATYDQMSYSINGRSLSRMPIKDLLYFKEYYSNLVNSEVAKENARLGIKVNKKNKIYVSFSR